MSHPTPEGDTLDTKIDGILFDYINDWDEDSGGNKVSTDSGKAKAAINSLIQEKVLEELKKVAANNNSEYTSDYLEERIKLWSKK